MFDRVVACVFRWKTVWVAVIAGACCGSAMGQFVGPVPPKPAAAPEYVPPPPPPPREIVAQETAPEAPSIIDRDSANRLQLITGDPALAALNAYPFEQVRRDKIEGLLNKRRADTLRFVANHLPQVIDARALRDKLVAKLEFNDLFAARDLLVALRQEGTLDRLQREGGISALQRLKIEAAVNDYVKARRQDWETQAAGDPTQLALLSLHQAFLDGVVELTDALDTQCQALADLAQAAKGNPAIARERAVEIQACAPALPALAAIDPNLQERRKTQLIARAIIEHVDAKAISAFILKSAVEAAPEKK